VKLSPYPPPYEGGGMIEKVREKGFAGAFPPFLKGEVKGDFKERIHQDILRCKSENSKLQILNSKKIRNPNIEIRNWG
jgi:hypothetical protein